MSYSLFIDDERDPPNDGRQWRIARTLEQVEMILTQYGDPMSASIKTWVLESQQATTSQKPWLKEIWANDPIQVL